MNFWKERKEKERSDLKRGRATLCYGNTSIYIPEMSILMPNIFLFHHTIGIIGLSYALFKLINCLKLSKRAFVSRAP